MATKPTPYRVSRGGFVWLHHPCHIGGSKMGNQKKVVSTWLHNPHLNVVPKLEKGIHMATSPTVRDSPQWGELAIGGWTQRAGQGTADALTCGATRRPIQNRCCQLLSMSRIFVGDSVSRPFTDSSWGVPSSRVAITS